MRPSENAAGTAISIVMTTTTTEITAELRKNVRYCVEVSSALKFSSVGWNTHQGFVIAAISPLVFRPMMSMYTGGMRKKMANITRKT